MHNLLEKLLAAAQYPLPQHLLTALVHRFMRIKVTWLKNMQIRIFARATGVDWREAAGEDVNDYSCFNAFFTRELKPGARIVDPEPTVLLSPCDGRLSASAALEEGRLFQAKGMWYSLDELLAEDQATGDLRGGRFWTIYLSPRDYHRVHMPLDGELRRMIYVPGDLFSVAPYTVRHIPRLFARNERVASIFETPCGPMALVLVGAMLVAGMETVWAGEVTPATRRSIIREDYRQGEVWLKRGGEMGRFNMGSTVIVILPPGAVLQPIEIDSGDRVLQGQRLATLRL